MVKLGAVLAALLLLAACAAEGAGPDGEDSTAASDPAPGEGLTVVATAFPLAWMARTVAPGADHTDLAGGGQDPHDLELTPADRALLETADVVLYMGDLGFQPQIEAAVGQRTGVTVDVRAIAGDQALHPIDHADEVHTEDDDHGAYDPHLWFDAGVMAGVATAVGDALAEVDPGGAEAYRAGAQAIRDDLLALDRELDRMLAECRHRTAIVSHEAYAYLLEPRGLSQEGVSGAGGHGEASAQRLAELTRRIRGEAIPAVLAEPVEGRADARALAAEADVDVLDIDPLEVAGEEALATGYPGLLRRQAEQFARALECSGDVR